MSDSVRVKIEGDKQSGVSPLWRESSYDFDGDDPITNKNASGNANGFNFKQPIMEEGPQLHRVSFAGSPSRSSFTTRRSMNLARTKTKSRLLDLPETDGISEREVTTPRKSSQFMKKAEDVDEEEDPLFDDDMPDDYKKEKAIGIWFVFEWVSLVLIVAALVCSLTISYLKAREVWRMKLWKWEVLVLVLICGRLVSGWIIRMIVFCVERNFLLRKRVLYFVYGLRHAVQNCLWLALVLLAWHFLFDRKVERETSKYVTKILVCLLVGTLIWLIKTLFIKVLASSFHVKTYFDRIQDSLFNQYVIETLSGPPLTLIAAEEVKNFHSAGTTLSPGLSPKSARLIGSRGKSPRASSSSYSSNNSNFKNENNEGINIDHLNRLNTKNVSAWNMKRLVNLVRKGSLSTLDEQLKDSIHDDETTTKIKSEKEAKTAARKILLNVAKPGCRFIYLEDLLCFMHEDEALKTMSLFESESQSNRISKSALKNWVVDAFRERRALALTLNDTKTAVNKLHKIVNILVAIVIVVIWLLMLEIATSRFFLFLTSQLVVVAFIFGNTCKTIFESIIFLFVMHPFDVGDRCEIDGVQIIVEEMNILTTVFLRYDNQKITYPNTVLLNKSIANYYRSPDMGDAIEFCVHIATPPDKIATVKQRIVSYIENKKDHWYSAPLIIVKDLNELNRMRIAVWLTHKMNHQNMGERYSRRSMLIEEMIKIFRELDIQYRLYPIDINVRSIPHIR